jgi:hypothetical protein
VWCSAAIAALAIDATIRPEPSKLRSLKFVMLFFLFAEANDAVASAINVAPASGL